MIIRMIKKLSTIAILGVITCLCLFSGCGKILEKVEILQYELNSNGDYYIITGKTDKAPKKLEIPSEHNGLPVREIAINAFSGWLELDSLTIPTSITRIGDNAFYGCKNMQNLTFENPKIGDDTPNGKYNGFNEGYLEIGYSAFYDCDNITKLILGTTVKKIESNAFYDCDNLFDVSVERNVEEIMRDSFYGCDNLMLFSVAENNSYYSSFDGVLYNKDVTELLYYPTGKTDETFGVPDSVTEIAPYAFFRNKYLQLVDLYNIAMVRQYAFKECTALANITAQNLNFVEVEAFENTAWLNNQTSEMVVLGNVLMKYQGTAKELSIENVKSIAPYAFANNESLETITLNLGLINIGDKAFFECKNLKTVYISNTNSLIFVSQASFDSNADGRVIYVPFPLYNEYLENALWQQYKDSVQVHKTDIDFQT